MAKNVTFKNNPVKVAGPTDCELGSALQGSADAGGTWKSTKGTAIKLVKTINGVDCTSKAGACIIGVTDQRLWRIVEHYADKAALLLDGRIVKEWSDSEIAAVREQGADRFEELLATQSETQTETQTRNF